MMRKNIENYYRKYTQKTDLGSCFGRICLPHSRCGAFWGGPGLEPLRAPLYFLDEFRTILLKIEKIPEQHFDTS